MYLFSEHIHYYYLLINISLKILFLSNNFSNYIFYKSPKGLCWLLKWKPSNKYMLLSYMKLVCLFIVILGNSNPSFVSVLNISIDKGLFSFSLEWILFLLILSLVYCRITRNDYILVHFHIHLLTLLLANSSFHPYVELVPICFHLNLFTQKLLSFLSNFHLNILYMYDKILNKELDYYSWNLFFPIDKGYF